MGPKQKKTKKNAFSCFLDEYVEKQREKGKNISHKTAAEQCSFLWKELSDEEKERFKKKAERCNENRKNNMGNNYTSQGETFNEVLKRQEMQQKKLENADKEIKMTLSNLNPDSLSLQLFYLIHCNYYCKTDTNIYIPAEIAISEFNLKDGVRNTYHQLIDPGEIPVGFAFEAQHNINEIHNLPYPPYSQGNSNFFQIYNDIINFIKPGTMPGGKIPPFFCLESNINACESILNEISELARKKSFRIYSLSKMFFALKNKCAENKTDAVGFPVLSNAIMELEKDIFCYVPGISCDYHFDMEDKYYNCSLSIVVRYVYVICDHCCELINIPIVPGKHCRLNCDVNRRQNKTEVDETKECQTFKPEKPKIKDTTLNYFYEGNDDSDWTKITSKSFYDIRPSESMKTTIGDYVPSCFGHGRGDLRHQCDDCCEKQVGNSSLPPYGRGRGRF